MSDIILAAIIGMSGAVIVAVASIISQSRITRMVIRADREKVLLQIRSEEIAQARQRRLDCIRSAVSELLGTSDPQTAGGTNYGRTVNLVLQVQLLLDITNPSEAALNQALNQLAVQLQNYAPVQHLAIDERIGETKNLLVAHSEVVETARILLRQEQASAT